MYASSVSGFNMKPPPMAAQPYRQTLRSCPNNTVEQGFFIEGCRAKTLSKLSAKIQIRRSQDVAERSKHKLRSVVLLVSSTQSQ